MANEAHTPTVLIARFPEGNRSHQRADERTIISQVLSDGVNAQEVVVYDAGYSEEGAIPVLAQEGFDPDQVNLLHLSGSPFAFGDTPLGSQERHQQAQALQRLSESIRYYRSLQVVVLSGGEHEELVRQLLLIGVPMVLSLRPNNDLPEQIEAFYAGLAAGQSVRQTLEMLSDAYPEWELGFHEINYDPEREALYWDPNRYPEGPNWLHGLVYRENQWRSLTWRLRNPLVIPLSERRRWERRGDRSRRREPSDPAYTTLLSTITREGDPPTREENLEVRGRSRALRRGAQKSRELRERAQKKQQTYKRRRIALIVAGIMALIGLVAGPFVLESFNRGPELPASVPPCPFPQQEDTYRVLVLPIKQTPNCNGGAAYLAERLIVALKALRQQGFKIDIRYQPIDACPLTPEVVETTADLCFADLVVWGNYQLDTLGQGDRLDLDYHSQNLAGEQIFITGTSLTKRFEGGKLPYADSLMAEELSNLVLWARGYRYFNQENYDLAIRAFLAIDPGERAVSSLVTQMLTRSYVQAGRYEQAREYFGRLIDMHPDETGYYLDRANMLTLMDEPEAALADLDRVLQLEPDHITAQVRRAKVYEQLARYDQALADMDAVLASTPDLPALYCRRAEIHQASGDLDAAIQDYEAALDLDSTYAEAHLGLGLIWQARDDRSKALAAVDEALRHDPTLVEAGLFRGDMLAQQERWEPALAAYTDVIERQASAEAYTRRAEVYEALGRDEKALQDFKAATALKPTHTSAWMGRARRYAATQRYEAALSDVNRVLEQQPRHPEALRLRTELNLMRREWDSALTDVNLLLDETPGNQEAFFFKATALLEKGAAQEADRMANVARGMGANSDRFRLLQGRISLALREPEEALRILDSVLKAQPDWGEAYHFRGLAHLQLKQDQKAQADLERSAQLGGQQMDTYLKLGQLYQQAHRYEAAKQAFQNFIQQHPERPNGYLARGKLYQELYRFDSALADFDRGLSLSEAPLSAYLLARGEVKAELGQFNQALVDYNQVLRQRPNDFTIYCLRGQLYQQMGNATKAELDLKQAVKLAPASPEPWYYLGQTYRRQNRDQEALQAVNKALQLDSTFASGYNLRGELWVDLETYDRAIADFNQALRLDPSHADAYDNRGDLARQAGDFARAIENYTLALNYNPRHADALYHRGFIYSLQGRHESAVRDISASLEVQPNVGLRYGVLAQIYARERTEEPFFHYLQMALDHGYPLSELEDDPAFRNYRDHPRFQKLMNAYGQ